MKRIVLIIFVSIISQLSFGQSLVEENLTKFQWTTDSSIDGINLGAFDEIGLSKLRIATDSLKEDCSIWTFTENEIIIQWYTVENGVEPDYICCSYKFNNNELVIIHFIQDSTIWEYNVGIASTENYIVFMRKNK